MCVIGMVEDTVATHSQRLPIASLPLDDPADPKSMQSGLSLLGAF